MHRLAPATFLIPLTVVVTMVACDPPKKASPSTPPAVSVASAAAAPTPTEPPPATPEPSAEPEPESIAAQHVLIAYRGAKGSPRTVKRSQAEARKLAEQIVAKARAGADFSELAAEFSDDPGTNTNRGNLGKFTKDKMVPEFAGPAFKLREGEISDVVETPFGYHVIKRNQ
jgi:hypothetical protein